MHPNTEKLYKNPQHNQIQKSCTNPDDTTKYKKALEKLTLEKLTTQQNTKQLCKTSQHNQIQNNSTKAHNTTECRKKYRKAHNTTE